MSCMTNSQNAGHIGGEAEYGITVRKLEYVTVARKTTATAAGLLRLI